MNIWIWMIASALAMLAASAAYVRVRWRRAPAAFRAMSMLGIVSVLAGVLIGYSANHLLSVSSVGLPWRGAGDSPPDPVVTDGKVPALDVGKSVVLTDEKHSGDPMWVSSSGDVAAMCVRNVELEEESKKVAKGLGEEFSSGGGKLSSDCIGVYLARHALGKDLDRGPKDAWISLEDVAEMCDAGQIEKSWPVCVDAYDARHAKMR